MRTQILAAAVLGFAATQALADGDAAKGEKVFKQCAACHVFEGKTNKVGPYLTGVIGRPVATAEGYNYSEAMKAFAATGAKWDEATLDRYLANPKEVAPGTKMTFAGLKKEDQRQDIIAFLKTKM